MKENDLDLIPLKKLSSAVDMFLTHNHDSPVKITGVAECNLSESRGVPYRKGYLVLYEKYNSLGKAEINEELYHALKLVFSTINDLDNLQVEMIDPHTVIVIEE
jgi:hypothetical protein